MSDVTVPVACAAALPAPAVCTDNANVPAALRVNVAVTDRAWLTVTVQLTAAPTAPGPAVQSPDRLAVLEASGVAVNLTIAPDA